MISRVRGTEDILDLTLRNYAINAIKKHMATYNFSEIQTPILEYTNLFIHAVGQATDIVTKEMYIIDREKADGDKSLCLRPEATAAIIRACHSNKIQRFPWKVFTSGPMFRYERPQKGRLRQFTQVSIENIGSKNIAEDAQFIAMLDALFSRVFSFENYVIKINFLGTVTDRQEHRKALMVFLEKHTDAICATCQTRKEKNALRILDCKNETCKSLYTQAPKITDYLSEESKGEWDQLQTLLKHLSINVVVDDYLVRGLDYYEKTVFEFCSNDLGAQNAFCAGGRYLLGKEVGMRENLPSIGTAIGVERLLLMLEAQEQLSLPQQPPLHVILPVAKEQDELALLLAAELQNNGLATDIIFDKASMSNMMKKANKLAAKFVLIIGEEEQTAGTVMIKNMTTGNAQAVKQSAVLEYLK